MVSMKMAIEVDYLRWRPKQMQSLVACKVMSQPIPDHAHRGYFTQFSCENRHMTIAAEMSQNSKALPTSTFTISQPYLNQAPQNTFSA